MIAYHKDSTGIYFFSGTDCYWSERYEIFRNLAYTSKDYIFLGGGVLTRWSDED
jgi:hypothetical protein